MGHVQPKSCSMREVEKDRTRATKCATKWELLASMDFYGAWDRCGQVTTQHCPSMSQAMVGTPSWRYRWSKVIHRWGKLQHLWPWTSWLIPRRGELKTFGDINCCFSISAKSEASDLGRISHVCLIPVSEALKLCLLLNKYWILWGSQDLREWQKTVLLSLYLLWPTKIL